MPNQPNKNPPGRKQLLTDVMQRKIVREIRSGKCETAVDMKKNLETHSNVVVSTDTVRRTLHKAGLKGRAKVKKPLLTKRHRALRLKFAQKYRNWTGADWERVLFSDEVKINRFGSDGRHWTWKCKGQTLQSHHVVPTVKFGGGSIMVWGSMMKSGVGTMKQIVGRMNANQYVDILRSEIPASATKHGFECSDIVFQQDNDPKHTARITKNWFEEKNINVLDWPPQSPDLNPIEHLWSILKRQMCDTSGTTNDLWLNVTDAWDKIPNEICFNLIESMPRRIQAVLKAKGGYTKY